MMNPTLETGPPPSCIGQGGGRPMARPWERPKARAKARARASNGLMCVNEGRPNVTLKENSVGKIFAPGGTLLSSQMVYLAPPGQLVELRRLLVQVPIPKTNSPL